MLGGGLACAGRHDGEAGEDEPEPGGRGHHDAHGASPPAAPGRPWLPARCARRAGPLSAVVKLAGLTPGVLTTMSGTPWLGSTTTSPRSGTPSPSSSIALGPDTQFGPRLGCVWNLATTMWLLMIG